jgi:hypothetical protein
MPGDNLIYLNGIDGQTGQYLVQPMDISDAAAFARGEPKNDQTTSWLARVWRKIQTPFLGLPLGVDPTDITQAGWGIVFLRDEDPAVKSALQPLIDHRRKQINNDAVVKVLDYQEGEDWQNWLARYNVAPGSVIPSKIPYYLLLVGDPARIPFGFGQLLSVEYGVGRLHFDLPEDYAAYAASLIDYETSSAVPNEKEAVFFGVRHPFDPATQNSADFLVAPLADGTPGGADAPAEPGAAQKWGYRVRKIMNEEATKAALLGVIAQNPQKKSPALLFSASHGMGFPLGDPNQIPAQGALLCQNWPGFGAIGPNNYCSAADIPAGSRVHGMVMFHFACYSAGTPERDQFIHRPGQPPRAIASKPFLAALPKRWLTHPQGGALACIGHVERAWGYSIIGPHAGPQIQTFQNAIGRILTGQPLGYALKDFKERYAALSTSLSAVLQQAEWGGTPDPNSLAAQWIERNDAEGYLLIGDPAAKIRVGDLQ